MKLTPITGFILCAAILVHAEAQRAESTRRPTAEPARTVTPANPTEGEAKSRGVADLVIVNSGKLKDVVKSLEERRPDAEGAMPWIMPNVIFAPGAEDAEVPTSMRLRGVSPAQALALVAAAAGCDLEPLFAPPERDGPTDEAGNSDFALQKIIGYRMTLRTKYGYATTPSAAANAAYVSQSEELGGVGLTLTQQNDKLIVNDVIEGMPASRSNAIKKGDRLLSVTDQGHAEVNVSALPVEKVTELVRGKPGTSVKLKLAKDDNEREASVVGLIREKLVRSPQPESKTAVTAYGPLKFERLSPPTVLYSDSISDLVTRAKGEADSGGSTPALPSAAITPGKPFVRIYALGTILGGPSDATSLAKENDFRELIRESLVKADAGETNLDLSFHKASRVLVAKATAAQHEIIQQLIAAMRENETPSPRTP
jgi:PDZ domain